MMCFTSGLVFPKKKEEKEKSVFINRNDNDQ